MFRWFCWGKKAFSVADVTRRVLPPTLVLTAGPTAVERLSDGLFVKRDDQTSALYGGNKVRKLERFFGDARAQGKTRILTLGAAGSHQVLASALFGAQQGFTVEAVLVPQPWSAHAEANLRYALAHGLVPLPAPAWVLGAARATARRRPDVYFVPLGGSNPLGSLAYVDAAGELVTQIVQRRMPAPSAIVVALGSGGTTAGLAAGLAIHGLSTRVIGVAVADPAPALAVMAKRLAFRTARLAGASLRVAARAAEKVSVTGAFVGRGYGHPTPEGTAAIAEGERHGLALDATYTAKAFACALTMARGPVSPVLYWHTLAAPLPSLDADAPPLPPALARLFRR